MSHATAGAPSLAPVHSFSQEAIATGKVLYLHSHPEAWSDTFTLDVASGLGTPLEGIRMELEVLPTTIPLEGQNFSVSEGGARTLAPPLLQVTGPYFPTLPSLSLRVLEPPQHGALQREGQPKDGVLDTFSWREVWSTRYLPIGTMGAGVGSLCLPTMLSAPSVGWTVVTFPPMETKVQQNPGPPTTTAGCTGAGLSASHCPQVEEQQIRYVHDGSEVLTDSFILVANASEMDRQSQPVTFTVTILPINDQPPVLTTNMGLQVRAPQDHTHLNS